MTSAEIRNSFLQFFKEHGHTIVPSSSVIPYDDPTLLFTNAGMNQFKDVFLGTGKRNYSRAADTQKCIRVSGKHNDLEEVGHDTYHHTFFEMLGNWSFGDYYKKEAIEWAWELLTKVWRIPKNRLWATVYNNDQEAEQFWRTVTDIDPKHILRFDEKDNFWEMGETGPCGPCSEIHIDRTQKGTATASMVNAGTPDVMEIWNLVFIQYNRDETGKLTPLPAKHVDTGMGFERVCAILQGKNSNYDTDIFTPIIDKISEISKQPYNGNLKSTIRNRQLEIDVAMRVIADHIRTLTFAIGDGAIPSNEGRGYVLRRILRRTARFGRNLGIHEPFIYQLVPTLVEMMNYIFPEIKTNQEHIQQIIKGEEEGFNATLDRGLQKFEEIIQRIGHSKTFPGEDAFKLYDTYGFPFDLTELMASERGLKVDEGMFTELMEKQKENSRKTGIVTYLKEFGVKEESINKDEDVETIFVGYEHEEYESTIYGYGANEVLIHKTPFYAESGGQVGDTGIISGKDFMFMVQNTKHDGPHIRHIGKPAALYDYNKIRGLTVTASIDVPRRHSIMRNHSATHLLHNALRRVLGTHVQQAGSLVATDYLRFDFSHYAKMSEQELADVEALVNEKIKENIPHTPGLNNIPFEDAKKMGALMFFGEKYGDRVNIVQFGDFSTEFCAGTHVNNTSEIGFFKIRSEVSVASGVRRIEAVTHSYALELLKQQDHLLAERISQGQKQLDELTKLKTEIHTASEGHSEYSKQNFDEFAKFLSLLKPIQKYIEQPTMELASFFSRQENNKKRVESIILQISDAHKALEKEIGRFRLKSLSGSIDEMIAHATLLNGIKMVTVKVQASSMDELKSLGDSLRSKLGSGVGLLATVLDEKAQLVCVVTDDLIAAKKIEAGKVVGAVAKLIGGGGGGRPHMATAGGKDVGKLDDALLQTQSIIQSLLK